MSLTIGFSKGLVVTPDGAFETWGVTKGAFSTCHA